MCGIVALVQLFISSVITINLMILCKKKKTNQVSNQNMNPEPVPIPYDSKTESNSAMSPSKGAATSATPAPKTTSLAVKPTSLMVPIAPPPEESQNKTIEKKGEVREKEKKMEKSLNSAFNDRLKEDQSAGVSELV
ncbi:hypothetical protein CRE_20192 [Caenorhabditis remanei]|uniref:Uncharacterized protein n=1 Tax=Caenorhabditis remanei TaxID=31234 RepID=E3MCK5_CAERE|nr:hypothetical protein CRE_20192 [Caenorhabditis remanei]